MKLGDVLKKERDRKKIPFDDMASKLGLPPEEYKEMEDGSSEAEKWGPLLAKIAIKLETPTSRLLADSGKSADCKAGQAGELIRKHRERRSKIEQADEQLRLGQINQTLHDDLVRKHRESAKTVDELAEYIEVSKDEYEQIEAGQSGIEKYGPLLLHYAEVIEQPVFNLFYPCGLPLEKLDDYP